MTFAPQSASWRTQVGPERTRVRSSTVNRASALEARGKGIAGVSNAGLSPPQFLPADRPGGPEFPRSHRHCLPAQTERDSRAASRSCRTEAVKWERPSFRHFREASMKEDVFNVSVRKFLKKVGITSQREIEQAVRQAIAGGRLKGNEALPAKMSLTVEGVGLALEIEGA